ncbi:MAG TPA: transaldolase family protein [Mycobacteriales bacterium]
MAIYLDSADPDDLVTATEMGFVTGVTTNPSLMHAATEDPLKHAAQLLAAADLVEFFYQPTGAYGSPLDEALAARDLDPQRVVLKLMATPAGVRLAGTLVARGARVALTAAQTPVTMAVAEAAGCVAVIPYVDRAWRDGRTESHLVRALAELRRSGTRIVAASVKNVGQLTQAFVDGADAVSAPLDVLEQVLDHPAGVEAEQAFAAEYGTEAGAAVRSGTRSGSPDAGT